jgi:hypothetical protein
MQDIWNTDVPGAELTVSRACGRAAVQHMLDHPGHTISLWPQKLRDMWGPVEIIGSESTADHVFRVVRWAYWPPFLLLACYGMWLSRKTVLTRITLLCCLMAAAIHVVTVGSPTYRLPWEILLAVPVAVAIVHLARALASVIGSRPVDRLATDDSSTSEGSAWDSSEPEEKVA